MEGVHISVTHFVKTRHKSSLSVTLFVTLVLFIICWAIWAAIHIHVTHKSQGPLAQSNTGTHTQRTHIYSSRPRPCPSLSAPLAPHDSMASSSRRSRLHARRRVPLSPHSFDGASDVALLLPGELLLVLGTALQWRRDSGARVAAAAGSGRAGRDAGRILGQRLVPRS
jgi:hypothetical protein